ncbi:MAG: hypothetical protein HY905_20735 [Deltaproteobacteria bacterium]|nr:hypothetical protein [Deltaproteobacteria bacterium]
MSLAVRSLPRPFADSAARGSALAALALASAAMLAAGCRGKDAAPAASDASDAPPAFVPGPLRDLAFDSLRLHLRAPQNLDARVDGDVVTLDATGFPPVTIRVESTPQASGSGGGGACRDGSCSFTRDAPCRRMTCTAAGAGEFVTVIPAICGSLESTFVPAGIPAARALSTGGTHTNCDETQLAVSQSLAPKIAGLLPAIDECWRAHADDDPAWRSGETTVRLARSIQDDGRATYELSAVLSGLEGDKKNLQDCLDATVAPLRGHLPVIGNAVCAFEWDHRFALAREPSCAREASLPDATADATDDAPDAPPDAERPARVRSDAAARPPEPQPAANEPPDAPTEPQPSESVPSASFPSHEGTVDSRLSTVDAPPSPPTAGEPDGGDKE